MLTRVLDLSEEATAHAPVSFSDELPAWAASAIQLAAGAGIVDGYPDGTFKAEQPLSGLETICILARITEKITWPDDKKTPESEKTPSTPTKSETTENRGDALLSSPAWSNLPPWARPCAQQLKGKDILPEYLTGRLFPSTNLTRAGAAAIMHQLWLKERHGDQRDTGTVLLSR